MKQLLAARAGKASGVGSAVYTNNAEAELRQKCPVTCSRDWLDPAMQSAAFRCSSVPLKPTPPRVPLCPCSLPSSCSDAARVQSVA